MAIAGIAPDHRASKTGVPDLGDVTLWEPEADSSCWDQTVCMKVLISIPKPHWSVPHMPAMLSTYFPVLPKSPGLEPVNGIPQASLPVGLQFSSKHGRHVH